jgi:hypothetical protein
VLRTVAGVELPAFLGTMTPETTPSTPPNGNGNGNGNGTTPPAVPVTTESLPSKRELAVPAKRDG